VVICAKKRLQGFCLIKISEFCMVTMSVAVSQGRTQFLKLLTRIQKILGLIVGMPKHAHHLSPDYSPLSYHVSVDHDNRVSNSRVFHTVVREHCNGIRAKGVGNGEGGEALVLVEEHCQVRATKWKLSWTTRNWDLIQLCPGSRDGLNE